MKRYQAGDKVRRIKWDNGHTGKVGQIAEVVTDDGSALIEVRYDGMTGDPHNKAVETWARTCTELISGPVDRGAKAAKVAAFNMLHDQCGIEAGDQVRLVRNWCSTDFGIGTVPFPGKHIVGNVYTVTGTGLCVRDYKHFYVDAGGYIPFFALELVRKKPKWVTEEIRLNSLHVAKVEASHVTVGCQTFSFDAVKELYYAVVRAEEALKS